MTEPRTTYEMPESEAKLLYVETFRVYPREDSVQTPGRRQSEGLVLLYRGGSWPAVLLRQEDKPWIAGARLEGSLLGLLREDKVIMDNETLWKGMRTNPQVRGMWGGGIPEQISVEEITIYGCKAWEGVLGVDNFQPMHNYASFRVPHDTLTKLEVRLREGYLMPDVQR